jgi:hypothetical protein
MPKKPDRYQKIEEIRQRKACIFIKDKSEWDDLLYLHLEIFPYHFLPDKYYENEYFVIDISRNWVSIQPSKPRGLKVYFIEELKDQELKIKKEIEVIDLKNQILYANKTR